MTKRRILFAAALTLLLGGALAVRRPDRPPQRVHPIPVPSEATSPQTEPNLAEEVPALEAEERSARPGADALFQNLGALAESEGSREDIVRVTAEFLGLEGGAKEAFERAVEDVLVEWAALQHEMGRAFTAFPEDLPDEELERLQRETEERFVSRREAIVCRLQVFTEDRDLRGRLPEWVEGIYAAAR